MALSTEDGRDHKVSEPTEGEERRVGVLARVLLDERGRGGGGGDPGELAYGSAAVSRRNPTRSIVSQTFRGEVGRRRTHSRELDTTDVGTLLGDLDDEVRVHVDTTGSTRD